jgi:hypothetical protein
MLLSVWTYNIPISQWKILALPNLITVCGVVPGNVRGLSPSQSFEFFQLGDRFSTKAWMPSAKLGPLTNRGYH